MLIKVILLTLIAGVIGTGLGGLLCTVIKNPTKRLMHLMFTIACGVMLGISFLHLLPEAIELTNVFVVTVGLSVGVVLMLFIEKAFDKAPQETDLANESKSESMSTMGMILFLSIALHNLPEGLAIGGGVQLEIGLATAISIGVHNIPEGMAIGLPMKLGGKAPLKILLYCLLTGLPTLIGGILGYFIGQINGTVLSLCLSLAAGAMIAVVFIELVPQTVKYASTSHPYDTAFAILGGVIVSILLLAL